jgi:heme/copper-type cytochrome/quinol oxidase subunit 2
LLKVNSSPLNANLSFNQKTLNFDSYIANLLKDFSVDNSKSDVSRTFKSGYQTIRSDIGSQRRLRVTKGIYLPADIPLHGIFGSKDVIHSWAIPGMGIKIDCIPGYSSHRRIICRWRGLF